MQAAQRESAESSQKLRGLEALLAELQQKLSLSAQAEAAARLETSKARSLAITLHGSHALHASCVVISLHCLP